MQHGGVALEMHRDHRVPLGLLDARNEGVPQDARVVHHHVELAESGDGLLDQRLGARPVGDVVGVGHCLAACGDDLVGHLLRRAGVRTGTSPAGYTLIGGGSPTAGTAEVVDHYGGAFGGEQQRVFTPDAPARAGYDGDAPLQGCSSHD